jgi:3-hydroxyisobutyrate dehydrogenase-like beta-hydroxyacid dehydrogenase
MATLRGIVLITTCALGTTTAMTSAKPVGFIGLGIMGEGMANNLLKAGIPVHVWSRDRKKSEAFSFAAESNKLPTVFIEDTPADVIASSERTYLMLSTPAACEEVYTMAGGVLDGVSEGKQLIDCATLRPGDMSSLAKRVQAKGGTFVEAPVSGSKGPAAAGALIFMAAGDKAVFDAAAQVELAAMGKKSVFCGEEVGTATRMKLVVNTIMGARMQNVDRTYDLYGKPSSF